MSTLRTSRVVIATVAAVVLLGACGSDGDSSASRPGTSVEVKAPVGAKENAVLQQCLDLYRPDVEVVCAENTIGPGGGVVFYDAGNRSSWGRYLEVAPWNWNPQYGPGESENCDCGADSRSLLRPRVDETQDRPAAATGYGLCGVAQISGGTNFDSTQLAGKTGTALGAGPDNRRVLLAEPQCSEIGENNWIGAVRLVAGYGGGGFTDWFVPSKDELHLLKLFGDRNAVGGFTGAKTWPFVTPYLSSSVGPDGIWVEAFGPSTGASMVKGTDQFDRWSPKFNVRPIRAF